MTKIVAKFSTLDGGCWIEAGWTDGDEYKATDRCFKFSKDGHAIYAYYSDLVENGKRARWYGHAYRSADFIFA